MNTRKLYTTLSRDADFQRRACRHYMQELQRGHIPSVRRLAVLTVFGGADEFYLEEQQALRQQYGLMRHPPGHAENTTARPARLRALHIAARVSEYMAQNPQVSIAAAVREVLSRGQAPRFYISVEHGAKLLRELGVHGKMMKVMERAMKGAAI